MSLPKNLAPEPHKHFISTCQRLVKLFLFAVPEFRRARPSANQTQQWKCPFNTLLPKFLGQCKTTLLQKTPWFSRFNQSTSQLHCGSLSLCFRALEHRRFREARLVDGQPFLKKSSDMFFSQDGYFMTGGTLTRNIGKQFGLALVVFFIFASFKFGFGFVQNTSYVVQDVNWNAGQRLERTRWMNIPGYNPQTLSLTAI